MIAVPIEEEEEEEEEEYAVCVASRCVSAYK